MPDTPPPPESEMSPEKLPSHKQSTLVWIGVGAVLIVAVGMIVGYLLATSRDNTVVPGLGSGPGADPIGSDITSPDATVTQSTTTAPTELTLGDGKYGSTPRTGYIYSCQTTFGGGGAHQQGDWIGDGVWYPNQKNVEVDGDVSWPSAQLSIQLQGDVRVISANGLPTIHTTGEYPVASTDDAYEYDRNPNTIAAQTVLFELPANPEIATTTSCLSLGAIGVAPTGVAIYNGLDGGGRDAAAHEILDHCQGHPERSGEYHYHNLSTCLTDSGGGHSPLVGYILDGFGIYGKFGASGQQMTNADLDECHGHTHAIDWDGTQQTMYHYHATDEYPYTIGCYKGTPVVTESQGSSQDSQLPSGSQSGPPSRGPGGGQLPPPPR